MSKDSGTIKLGAQPILECPDRAAWIHALDKQSEAGRGGCVIWTGPIAKDYGRFRVVIDGSRRMTGAHRAAWLARVGPIADGLVIDHLCRNRLCINVEHMEPVPNVVNVRRGEAARNGQRRAARRGCRKHGMTDGYMSETAQGHRRWTCRPCRNARRYKFRARTGY